MLNQLLPTYTQLMADLATLPAEITDLQVSLTEARIEVRKLEQAMTDRQVSLIETAGGMKALGSNDADRKQSLANMLRTDSLYQRYAAELSQFLDDATRLADDVSDYERRYTALGYQAKLLAGLFTALGNAALPAAELPTALPDVVFMQPANGRTHAPSHDDAEAIGL